LLHGKIKHNLPWQKQEGKNYVNSTKAGKRVGEKRADIFSYGMVFAWRPQVRKGNIMSLEFPGKII